MTSLLSTAMTANLFYNFRLTWVILTLITFFMRRGDAYAHSGHHGINHNHQDDKPKVEIQPNVQILIPNLPQTHYQYWLKNHPRAAKEFNEVCKQAGSDLSNVKNLADFENLHRNLSFEDPQYFSNLQYGKQTLSLICSKISDHGKSCWGYENNCQDIHLMPECVETNVNQNAQERKIAWFSQSDFGYILDRAREISKYCAPEKRLDPNEVSSFECTKHFTSCRGTNLYAKFNISNFKRNQDPIDSSRVLTEVGGWGCDLQKARIKEEAGVTGRLQSWYGELKNYERVDHLQPRQSCKELLDSVFFVKINSTSNLDDYLGTFINLYATIHLNNRFSDNNRIIVWDKHLPRTKTFEHLWYAFSRYPPMSLGQLDGQKICFKKFIFAMPPNMINGIHTDKPLVEGCGKSGLYHAFQKHVTHRLNIPNTYTEDFHRRTQGNLVRIVILSRSSESEFRNILNVNQLAKSLTKQSPSYYVEIVEYNKRDLLHNLISALNGDIMIGIHGTGLAYSLFLPDWAGLVELHDCRQERYRNLARLRGISYFKPTNVELAKKVKVQESSNEWSRLNQSGLLDHDEFSNYEVDVEKFIELFNGVKEQVLKARHKYFGTAFQSDIQITTAGAEAKYHSESSSSNAPDLSPSIPITHAPIPGPALKLTEATTKTTTASTTSTTSPAPSTTSSTTTTTTTTPSNAPPTSTSTTTTAPTTTSSTTTTTTAPPTSTSTTTTAPSTTPSTTSTTTTAPTTAAVSTSTTIKSTTTTSTSTTPSPSSRAPGLFERSRKTKKKVSTGKPIHNEL